MSCGVPNCVSCETSSNATIGRCIQCEQDYGLDDNNTCHKCSHRHCRCKDAGGCDTCDVGFGLVENATHGGSMCRKCHEGCFDCMFAESNRCLGCQTGFAMDGSSCKKCAVHCLNCTASGSGRCDECRPGFGYNDVWRECRPCEVRHCLKCEGNSVTDLSVCTKCAPGYGVTPEGLCESCGTACRQCDWVGKCSSCSSGYALRHGSCYSCADGCASCAVAGPAKCDRCLAGFRLQQFTKTCISPEGFSVVPGFEI